MNPEEVSVTCADTGSKELNSCSFGKYLTTMQAESCSGSCCPGQTPESAAGISVVTFPQLSFHCTVTHK